ncbi:hypothetical protein PL9631_780063 [Planktothrix paucivesiculata PCC 9631]|uniref:Uncharacterized protein n=1 Tax=Planktothrix paucivesiculata PCC 9631 TaxID=671071 RepID=A0A7Z9BXT4_9CYAN|nr:hypothetical protein PL9631_780063 [Planktothrix paucivesiculata PCC 9631]
MSRFIKLQRHKEVRNITSGLVSGVNVTILNTISHEISLILKIRLNLALGLEFKYER